MPRALVHDRAAERDMIEIWVYTFRTWGEAQAEKYFDAVEACVMQISLDPEAGRSRDALRAGYRSKTAGHHVVLYIFNDHEVRIRRVLHETMDFETHLTLE
jgi:toxin ParE1/3/4